jgi:hypothetical protein
MRGWLANKELGVSINEISCLPDCEVRTHASFDNGDLSKLKTFFMLEGHHSQVPEINIPSP